MADFQKGTAQAAYFFLKTRMPVKKVTASAVTFAAVTVAVSHKTPNKR